MASKAAMEAAKDIEQYLGLQDCTKPIQLMIAKRIDLCVADLLEKAETLYCRFGGYAPSHGCSCNNCELAKAIKPWKAGE